jgi:hypothetical protein
MGDRVQWCVSGRHIVLRKEMNERTTRRCQMLLPYISVNLGNKKEIAFQVIKKQKVCSV